jgi:hypothetical protein
MLGNRQLVMDVDCEVYNELRVYADAEFYNFSKHTIIPGAVYLIGRQQFRENTALIRELVTDDTVHVILSNPAEGSDTIRTICDMVYGVGDLVKTGKILILGGGDMDPLYTCLQYDSFLPKILDYEENIAAASRSPEIYHKLDKPFKFLFLNGRIRPHRAYLMNLLKSTGLIYESIWTCLDKKMGTINLLNAKYEYADYQNASITDADQFVKNQLFNNTWGEIYLNAEPYIDTYFSLVTETVFNYPYSFRTEKIWKPIAMGHPWIAVANCGYYRDMHNLGFKTFGHVIDQSFDTIQDNQLRLQRIAQVVTDLCTQDLASFLKECYNVCKYNQQHLAEMRITVREELPARFTQFITNHINE